MHCRGRLEMTLHIKMCSFNFFMYIHKYSKNIKILHIHSYIPTLTDSSIQKSNLNLKSTY